MSALTPEELVMAHKERVLDNIAVVWVVHNSTAAASALVYGAQTSLQITFGDQQERLWKSYYSHF